MVATARVAVLMAEIEHKAIMPTCMLDAPTGDPNGEILPEPLRTLSTAAEASTACEKRELP